MNTNKNHESSMILSSSYDGESLKLLVTFKGGSIYQYEGVVQEDYEAFVNGESIGRSFNEYIRKYKGSKLEETLITEVSDAELKAQFPSNVEGSREFNQANKMI